MADDPQMQKTLRKTSVSPGEIRMLQLALKPFGSHVKGTSKSHSEMVRENGLHKDVLFKHAK